MPAKRLFAPEACVPDKDLPVNSSQHDQCQTGTVSGPEALQNLPAPANT